MLVYTCNFDCFIIISYVISTLFVFFFKQKTAYEMRISDWSSDVCSSDLHHRGTGRRTKHGTASKVHDLGSATHRVQNSDKQSEMRGVRFEAFLVALSHRLRRKKGARGSPLDY